MTAAPEKKFAVDARSATDSDVESSGVVSALDEPIEKAKVPWWAYLWDYEPGRSKEETAFLRRLDTSVLIILSLGYFIKKSVINAS